MTKNSASGAGKMAWQFGALVALIEELCSIPNTYVVAHNQT